MSGACVCTSNYDDACESSSGYYGNNEACDINALTIGSLQVTAFSTEYGYDKLTVNGATYQVEDARLVVHHAEKNSPAPVNARCEAPIVRRPRPGKSVAP